MHYPEPGNCAWYPNQHSAADELGVSYGTLAG